MTIQFCNFSCTIAAAPRRAIAKPLLHSAAFHHRHVRLRHAFSLAICSYHTTTTTTTHYAASAHTHHHIHRHFLIHNHNPIRLHLPCLFQLLLRRTAQSLSLDDCATISATTTAHTPHPSFPSTAPPPSYMLPQLHHTPPTEPTTATQIQSPPAPQQATVVHHPPTDPQWTMPQGVWQPYSAFPPVTQPSPQPLPPPPPPLAIGEPPPAQLPQPAPSDPTALVQNVTTSAKDPTAPVQNVTTSATGSQPSPSPSIASAAPATAPSLPATDKPDSTASPAPPPPSPHPHHSSRRHHHKSRRKSDHHHRGRHHHRRRHRHHRHSKHHSTTRRRRSPSTSTYTLTAPHLPAAAPHNPLICAPTQTTPTPTPLNTPPQQSFVAHSTAGDLHPSKLFHLQTNFLNGSNFTPTNSTPPTDHSTSTSPISLPTATSPTRRSPISDNTPTPSGTKPPTNTTNSNTTPSHFPTSTPKPPHPNHPRFPEPPQPTGKSPTSTPAIQAQSATLPTFYTKVGFYPAHSTLPTTLAFLPRASITHNLPHDQSEFARIIHNTWQLHKNTHSIIITLLAWGAATKYTSGGEEQAMTLVEHHGAVFHQKGRCWVIHPTTP